MRVLLASLLLVPLGVLAAETPTVPLPDPPTADAILERHFEARGGKERWKALRSIQMEGTWNGFSEPHPMTLRQVRPDRYRLDHVLFGKPAVLGHEGGKTWLQGESIGLAEPVLVEDAWVRNVVQDARFGLPLLVHVERGSTIELVGREEIEGQAVWALRVKPEGEPEETWYLDAKTFLEVRRDSMTYDLFSGGIEMPMQTWYMDFDEVGELVIPLREERHFGTRYQVLDVESVKLDPELDPALFHAPPPPPPPTDAAAEDAPKS